MLETTPTLGSIETSNRDKEHLAQTSIEFNMKNKQFVKLFPGIIDEIKEKRKSSQQSSSQNVTANTRNGKRSKKSGNDASDRSPSDNQEVAMDESNAQDNQIDGNGNDETRETNSTWHSILLNLIVLICFALFAVTVNFVINKL